MIVLAGEGPLFVDNGDGTVTFDVGHEPGGASHPQDVITRHPTGGCACCTKSVTGRVVRMCERCARAADAQDVRPGGMRVLQGVPIRGATESDPA